MANACSFLELRPALHRPFPFIQQVVRITAYCSKVEKVVTEPYIGCGECHPLPFSLPGDEHDPNPLA